MKPFPSVEYRTTEQTDQVTEVRRVQDRFATLPAEDVVGYIVVTLRKLSPDECDGPNDTEVSVLTGGLWENKLIMVEQLMTALQHEQQTFGSEDATHDASPN